MDVVASRLASQGLASRARYVRGVLSSWAVQDSPPGAAVAALLARVEEVPESWMDGAIAMYNPRTATAVVPADEAAWFGTAFLPEEDNGSAVDAVSDALDGRSLSRDDLHEELRHRLPSELLPWCPGCHSHHARRGLLVTAGLHGRLCIVGRAGRQPVFARTDQTVGWDAPPRAEARAELVRRYRAWYGPSTPAEFAAWAGIEPAHARSLWALVDDDPPPGDAPPARGVRLLAPGDPLLLGRDRESLIADPALRKKVWAAVGGAGVVLSEGRPVALWRGRKQGRRLAVEIEPLGDVPRDAVRAEAERLAPFRGCTSVEVT